MWTLWLSLCSVLPVPAAALPSAVCGGRACFTAHLGRRTFHQAWRACRGRGGNLASVRRPDDQRLLEDALRGWEEGRAAAGRSAAPLRLWLGLQRQPRRCAPHKPLRGFTWTTGHQDTEFTNWLRPEPPGPCPDTRCAALTLGAAPTDYKWLGGPCRLAVDGYLCRYTYRGMCSPIELGLDEPVLYAAPFGITSTTLHHIPFGSVATLPCSEPVSMLCALSEDGAGVGWSGHPPFCQQGGGGPHHGCPPGFKPAAGGRGCVDADECAAVPCHHLCVNTAGSFRCRCRVGYALRRPGGLECVDVDECQFQGSCQQMCVNYPGHFECHCGEGFALEEDGSSCRSLGRVGVSFAVHEGLPPPIPGEGRGGLWPAAGGGDPFPEPSTGILLQSPETPLWVEPLPNQTGTPVREDPFPNQSGTTLSGDPLPALSGTSLGIDPLPEWSGTPMKGDHFPDSSTKTPMSAEPLPDWSGIPMGKDPLTNTSTRTSMRVDSLPDWFGTPVRGDHFPNPFTESTMNVEPLLNWSGTPMGKDPLTDTSVGVEPLPDQSKIPVRGDLLPELSETHMKDPLPNMSSGSPERGDPHPTSSGNPVETDRAPPHQPEGIPTLHRDAGHPGESREAETARWLLAALLVPVSVLGVVMLALAVACCARGRSRNATNVYRWISRSSKASDASVHGTGCIPDATETGAVTTTWQTDISTI